MSIACWFALVVIVMIAAFAWGVIKFVEVLKIINVRGEND